MRDLRYAARNLKRSPGFALAAIITLTLGIAPVTLVASFINAILFKAPRHYLETDRLAVLYRGVPGDNPYGPISYPDLIDLREQVPAFEGLLGFDSSQKFQLTDDEGTRALRGTEVTANYFDLLGVSIPIGRGFATDVDSYDGSPVVVLGHLAPAHTRVAEEVVVQDQPGENPVHRQNRETLDPGVTRDARPGRRRPE